MEIETIRKCAKELLEEIEGNPDTSEILDDLLSFVQLLAEE